MKISLLLLLLIPVFLQSQEIVDTIWTRQLFQIHDAKITPDGHKVVVSTNDGIYILDAESGEQLHFYENDGEMGGIELSSDGKYIY